MRNNLQNESQSVNVHEIKKVLEHYGARVVERKGWSSLRCPFHDDTHSSAAVNTQENVFCCFACQIKGNTYSIIMKHEGMDFSEAVKFAEGITGQSRKVLFNSNRGRGGLPRRTGNNSGSSSQDGSRSGARSRYRTRAI